MELTFLGRAETVTGSRFVVTTADAAAVGDQRTAVAVCQDCGAAVCVAHAVRTQHWLTRTQTIMRVERVEPATRLIRCEACHVAHVAQGGASERVRAPVDAPSHA